MNSAEYIKNWHKQRYERLKAEGMCIRCGKVPARPDRTTCAECAKRLSDLQKHKRQRYMKRVSNYEKP